MFSYNHEGIWKSIILQHSSSTNETTITILKGYNLSFRSQAQKKVKQITQAKLTIIRHVPTRFN
jgi:hypothetical protein